MGLEADQNPTGEKKFNIGEMKGAMIELSAITTLLPKQSIYYCALKFWLLLLGGLIAFFAWLVFFSHCANVWEPSSPTENASAPATNLINIADSGHNDIDISLFYLDVWFALGLMAAIDALAIVINFNRSLIHQFHYFVSLRMMSLAFIISAAGRLLYGNRDVISHWTQHPAAILILCCVFYILSIAVPERLHRLLPVRGIGASRGSIQKFSKQMCVFDLPWSRALLFAASNGAIGLMLTSLTPAKWSMLNPVIHITWEVTFLGLMETKQTPRYIWFATPIVQASTCTDWGLRQIVEAPSLVMTPGAFLAWMLAGRILLDVHLHTLFRHRADFQWARKEVLLSTQSLLEFFTGMLLLEYVGIPVVTFIKPIAVILLHVFGVLVFLLPACYAIAFNQIKTIHV